MKFLHCSAPLIHSNDRIDLFDFDWIHYFYAIEEIFQHLSQYIIIVTSLCSENFIINCWINEHLKMDTNKDKQIFISENTSQIWYKYIFVSRIIQIYSNSPLTMVSAWKGWRPKFPFDNGSLIQAVGSTWSVTAVWLAKNA